MRHIPKIVSEDCIEFFLEDGKVTLNLVPVSPAGFIPRVGEMVSLPGAHGKGAGTYQVIGVTYHYGEQPTDEYPCPAKFMKVTVTVRRPISRSIRRTPAIIDPYAAYVDGEEILRKQLDTLEIEQLRDVVAEYGMDSSKLAMKWKTRSRLIELIVSTVRNRARKGDAFRQ